MSNVKKKKIDAEAEHQDVAAADKDLSASELEVLHKRLAVLRAACDESAEKNDKSIHALIVWAACDFGVNEEVVESLVKRHFEVADISEIQESSRDELVRFLANLDIKQFIN